MGKGPYPNKYRSGDYDERVHSDDAGLHNRMPMRPTQLPPDANSEMTYLGEGEDRDDDDDNQAD